ncbi:hypothetical protein ACVGVP_25805 [Pseudonocardia artemisiae]
MVRERTLAGLQAARRRGRQCPPPTTVLDARI